LPTEFAARTATDLLLFHVIANIALTVIGVQRDLRALQAIEPIIGHVKQDHGMQRCGLKGQSGDALHAVLCAAGYNLRRLLRAIVRLGRAPVFFVLAWLRCLLNVLPQTSLAPRTII